MHRFVTYAVLSIVILPVSAQEIFRTKWQGMGLEEFSSTNSINQFSVSGPDAQGYVYLKAHSSTGSGDIIKTKWQGTAVQDFAPGSGTITGFQTTGPDFEGYVYLIAVASTGSTKEILKTKWQGSAVQDYAAPAGNAISGFTVSGPDASGYVTLSAATGTIGIGEKFGQNLEIPLVFTLNPITPNPCIGSAQISYSIAKPTKVNIHIYDCSGRLVKKLVDQSQKPGRYSLRWSGADDQGSDAGSGVYFVKMETGDFKAVRKIVKW